MKPILTHPLAKVLFATGAALAIGLGAMQTAQAVEEIPYRVLVKDENFELRQYESYVLAETQVKSNFEDAGNKAFQALFQYISGKNISPQSQAEKIDMTAPVIQQEKSEKIAMTAPVIQKSQSNKIDMTAPVIQQKNAQQNTYYISFVLPAKYTLKNAPIPTNDKVVIREVPEKLMAAIRYSGWWSEDNYQEHLDMLQNRISQAGYIPVGDPLYARYNAPFTPWFMRRNEILQEVKKATD